MSGYTSIEIPKSCEENRRIGVSSLLRSLLMIQEDKRWFRLQISVRNSSMIKFKNPENRLNFISFFLFLK